MAELVLGVAKSLVEGTLSRAQSAIEEESQLRKGTRRDLVFITGEFQMMQSYLSSRSQDNVKNNVVSTWVTQLRDLAYDVEDGIEFVVHLDTKPDWLLRVIPWIRARPLDEAVDIIEQLKVRVVDVRQRIEHYIHISDSGHEPAEETKQPATDRDLEALTNLITKKSVDLQVISVWVPGGDLMAASPIKKAYVSRKSWGNNFICCAWVKPADFSSRHEFVQSLLDQFGLARNNQMPVDEEYLQEVLDKYKCLVVLEDVSTEGVWDTIQKFFVQDNGTPRASGSRIVVITQKFQVASLWTGHPYIKRFWADFSLCVFSKEGPLVGRISEIKQLREYVAKAGTEALHVISVWGMAGAGKSALVRNLHQINWPPIQQFEKECWVDVTHPFELKAFCQSLFLQFNSRSLETNEDPVKKCYSLLREHKCLVVIDNLQSKQEWDLIKDALAFRPSQSVIIVITNEESIALHCADREEFVYNVKALEVEAAFNLFRKKVEKDAYLAKYDIREANLEPLVSMCGGLPKVIVAIADYLADTYTWAQKAGTLSEKFIFNLETRPEFTCLWDLFSWIHSYFRSCPDYLKPCIFYLSIFPKSQIIRRRRLVMRWVAEGYSKDDASDTAEENGEKIFAKIIELSMIKPHEQTVVRNMRMVRCQVSAFFHEYIITRPRHENVTFALEVFGLKGCCRKTTGRTGRHLVIEESWERDRIVFDTIDFSRLRSLTVLGKWESFFISERMKVLRVLDLENAVGVKNKDLLNMLKQLPRLKFLSLRGCRDISCLPDSVGNLRQLRILDVRYTSIVTMPASVNKLKELQYLRAGTNDPPENQSASSSVTFKLSQLRRCLQFVGVKVESGVGKLINLHTLGVMNVGSAGGKGILNELKNLTQLRKIGVSGVCNENIEEFSSAISEHSHLQSLSVWLKKNNEDSLSDMAPETKPPKKLQSLKLYGPVGKLPTWIDQLNSIKKMNLEIDILSAADINVIGSLQQLCILRLLVKPSQGGSLKFCVMTDGEEERCYKRLKVLEIATRSDLHLSIGSEAMKNLEQLKAGSCSTTGSRLQFSGLEHLSKLKEVWIIGSQSETLKKHMEEQFVQGPIKPFLKMVEVYPSAPATSRGNERHSSFPFFPTTPLDCQ